MGTNILKGTCLMTEDLPPTVRMREFTCKYNKFSYWSPNCIKAAQLVLDIIKMARYPDFISNEGDIVKKKLCLINTKIRKMAL